MSVGRLMRKADVVTDGNARRRTTWRYQIGYSDTGSPRESYKFSGTYLIVVYNLTYCDCSSYQKWADFLNK